MFVLSAVFEMLSAIGSHHLSNERRYTHAHARSHTNTSLQTHTVPWAGGFLAQQEERDEEEEEDEEGCVPLL